MLDLNAYAYQAPTHPEAHPDQCYYRPAGGSNYAFPAADEDNHRQRVQLFRFSDLLGAQLELSARQGNTTASLCLNLFPAAMLRLRDALNDALTDIAAAQDLQRRRESLDEIMEDFRNDPDGHRGAYYAHPDVHYCAPGQALATLKANPGPCVAIEDPDLALHNLPAGELPAPTAGAAAL